MTPAPRQHAAVLRRAALFAELSGDELQYLAARAEARRYGPGELIFSEGDRCVGLYVIEAGSVRIFKSSPDGREQVLGLEQAGGTVAELPVFDGGSYPASAAAASEASVLLVRTEDFRALCLEHPQVALKVLRVVGRRLRRLVGIIEELSFATVRQRLAALLARLARSEGRKTARGIELEITASNQELAAQIGTVRELVSRNLSRLQAEGLIEVQGRMVVIRRIEALEAEAGTKP